MELRKRNTTEQDLPACRHFLDQFGLYASNELTELEAMWRSLIRSQACRSIIVEDSAQSPPRIAVFAMSVCVRDGFMRALQAGTALPRTQLGRPCLGQYLLERYRSRTSPILTATAIDRTIGGVNVLGIHYAIAPDLSGQEYGAVLLMMRDAVVEHHRDLKLNVFAKELYSEKDVKVHLEFGFQIWGEEGSQLDTRPYRPYLIGIDERTACKLGGELKAVRRLFESPVEPLVLPIRLHRVLQLAIDGLSDKEIGDCTGVTVNAIKKSWDEIYACVHEQMPSLLPRERSDDRLENGSRPVRGKEKKQHLLRKLRARGLTIRSGPNK